MLTAGHKIVIDSLTEAFVCFILMGKLINGDGAGVIVNSLIAIFSCQIIGHSLGGGAAAILTYILREREEFSSSTCIAFAPGILSFGNYISILIIRYP